MKNLKKKGFTLVELLVVIAIIAILATVSVVGYTAFIKKANASNAVSELSQIKDAVMAAVLDGSETIGDIRLDYDVENSTLKAYDLNGVAIAAENAGDVANAILDLVEIELGQAFAVTIADEGKVTQIVYTYADDVTATWNIADGTVTAN